MLAEGAHSVADTVNQLFLLTALSRSKKPADSRHPFGYGMERYFWSLLAAVGIFVLGAGFSIYEGIHSLLHPEPVEALLVAYVVLGVSFLFEGASWLKALRAAAPGGRGAAGRAVPARVHHPGPHRQDGRVRGHRRADRHRPGRRRHHRCTS